MLALLNVAAVVDDGPHVDANAGPASGDPAGETTGIS